MILEPRRLLQQEFPLSPRAVTLTCLTQAAPEVAALRSLNNRLGSGLGVVWHFKLFLPAVRNGDPRLDLSKTLLSATVLLDQFKSAKILPLIIDRFWGWEVGMGCCLLGAASHLYTEFFFSFSVISVVRCCFVSYGPCVLQFGQASHV